MTHPPTRKSKTARRASGAGLMQVRGSAFELHKRGVARYDFRDPYHVAVTLSWPAFIAAVFVVLGGLNLMFAGLYLARPGAVQNLPPGDVLNAFFFSLETLSTVGYGEMAPATLYGHAISAMEIVVGMAFTAIITGLLFVRFSKPRAKILFADQAVIATHNAKPTLMVRIANGRLTMLTAAAAEIGILLAGVTIEGQVFRQVEDLKLIRKSIPIFPLTWTLMHVIDESSPLLGLDREGLIAQDARLFVSVEAMDSGVGARVQAIKDYDHLHVQIGKRYADAVSRDESGRTVADIGRLSLLEDE